MQSLPLESIYISELESLYAEKNHPSISILSELISPHVESIAAEFYRVMLTNEKTEIFLSNELVQMRLTATMAMWMKQLFVIPDGVNDFAQMIQQQIQVGHIHARIDLPMNLVNFGSRVLKRNMTQYLNESTISEQQKNSAVVLLNQLVDTMVALINESYVNDIVISEKNAQAFRMHVTSKALAFDCERLRASLLDWMREVLSVLCNPDMDRASVPSIRQSDFGLWLVHKGELILIGRSELPELLSFLSTAEAMVNQLISLSADDAEAINDLISKLNDQINQVTWLLSAISKEMMDLDNGRDSLTNLFNRRYVPTVLRHETECSIKTGMRFGILYADIDLFKTLNDQYGHDNGDTILRQFSDILAQNARAGDFVFRYGGEEFLMVIADIEGDRLPMIAEKVRKAVEGCEFRLLSGKVIPVTVSIGAALHDGHPDYERTIKNADKALYQAKESGRNRIEVFSN